MYKPSSNTIWKGRIDAGEQESNLRWHQVIQLTDLSTAELPQLTKKQVGAVLLGFACDEGVKRNKGRVGAAGGPETIRKACVNFAWHIGNSSFILVDGGDVVCQEGKLEEAQDELATLVLKVRRQGYFPVILGGGHEVSFGGYNGIFQSFDASKKSIGVINFDAHFDLRDFSEGANSGTSFSQISQLCSNNQSEYNYLCLGIQPQVNTRALFRKAEELDVDYLLGEDLVESNLSQIDKFIWDFIKKSDHIYLTVDLDAFDMSDAPGVSAPAMPGVNKYIVFRLIHSILITEKVIACDIAEMNPKYDQENRTAKLAAYLIYELVSHLLGKV